jgi:hypothetical protein
VTQELQSDLTDAELSNTIPRQEVAKFRVARTRAAKAFRSRQIAQAENDPFMWVVDLPESENKTSYIRKAGTERLFAQGKKRKPYAGEVDERHPLEGGGGFTDGRKPDPASNPRIRMALETGAKDAERYERQQKDAASRPPDERIEILAERLHKMELQLDTAVNKILSAMSDVRGSQAASEPSPVEPVQIQQALVCKTCGFEAKSRSGLTTHRRSKHRDDNGSSR